MAVACPLVENGSSVFDTCPLIHYNHLDKELLPFYWPGYNPMANCKEYKSITVLVDGNVKLRNKDSNHKCKARCLFPKGDRLYITEEWISLPTDDLFECDVVETECVDNGVVESFLHTQIYEKIDDEREVRNGSVPDVYLLIIDSASSFMMKRSIPKTIAYLKEHFGAVQMEFLNKIGDNSRPNGFPLMFGKSIEGGSRDLVGLPPLVPDWNDTKICAEPLDRYPYILSEYSKAGYKTMLAQDYGVGMVYYPNCTGFNGSQADHLWK
ncbi:unnamed protein product [Heligmosomoides polygyrus]|uniref:VWFA domain-containing protein n=1 Tax=Heligmosomoides polygyrus TaxID=6339 RepID=A0A183G945_HELPZ|nr:unnamed protein product [Heligmosomoides polygyrus]